MSKKPLYSDYGVLGYNADILNKYYKDVPKTWDELLETAAYILEQEKALGNTELVGFVGQFPNDEAATCSTYETIYSFRQKDSRKFPSLLSNEALQAIQFIKTMKKRGITDDKSLSNNEVDSAMALWSGKTIFARNWQFVGDVCTEEMSGQLDFCQNIVKISNLPGHFEGVSASAVGGSNIAISKLSKYPKEAAKVVDFLTSYEVQRKMIIEHKKLTALPQLYTDPEVCSVIDCNIYGSIHAIARPSSMESYSEYSKEFRKNILEAIKGETDVETALERSYNILAVKSIEYNSTLGKVINIITGILVLGCFASMFFVYCYHDDDHLQFLSYTSWFIYIFGNLLLLVFVVLQSGEITNLKCQFRPYLLTLGFSMINIPIFVRLLSNYPKNFGIPLVIRNNRFTVSNILLIIEMVIFLLWSIFDSFKKIIVINSSGFHERFYICDCNSSIGNIYFIFSSVLNLACVLGIAYLFIIEWQFPKYYLDVRNFCIPMYYSIAIIGGIITIKYVKIKNMYISYLVHTIPVLLYVFYMTFVVFLLKLHYILKEIPSEKKTAISNKSNRNLKKYNRNNVSGDSSKNSSSLSSLCGNSKSGSGNRSFNSHKTTDTFLFKNDTYGNSFSTEDTFGNSMNYYNKSPMSGKKSSEYSYNSPTLISSATNKSYNSYISGHSRSMGTTATINSTGSGIGVEIYPSYNNSMNSGGSNVNGYRYNNNNRYDRVRTNEGSNNQNIISSSFNYPENLIYNRNNEGSKANRYNDKRNIPSINMDSVNEDYMNVDSLLEYIKK